MKKRSNIVFKKLIDNVDSVYSRFKMNATQCEAQLYKLKEEVLDVFKDGLIDEDKHAVLEQRIEEHMREIKAQIEGEKSQ